MDDFAISSSSSSTTVDTSTIASAETTTNTEWCPRVLVLGPGGVKGLKILGFLAPIEDAKILDRVDTYCGVSVGAIIALFLTIGYPVREIVTEAATLDIFKELGVPDIKQAMEKRGLLSSEPLRRRLSRLVLDKCGTVPTLSQLYQQTGRSLVTVTLNATDEEPVMMSAQTHPHISCVEAVILSINIPFVFYQLVYQEKVYVDGALANPYPVDYFDDGNTDILGIYMKSIHKTPERRVNAIISPVTDNTIEWGAYWLKIVHSLMDQRRVQTIEQSSSRVRHVRLETTSTDTVGYRTGIEDKAAMLIEGFTEAKAFLARIREPPAPTPAKRRYRYPEYYL